MINEIIKKKSQAFRSNCLARAKKSGHSTDTIPMPKQIAAWLSEQPMIEKRKRWYCSCYLTNKLVHISKIELDHRIPLARGGNYSLDNLGITSSRLNAAKGVRTENEFKQLLELIATFDDKGASVIADLYRGANVFSQYKAR